MQKEKLTIFNALLEGILEDEKTENGMVNESIIRDFAKIAAKFDCCVISACKGNYTPEENKKRTAHLRHDLKRYGLSCKKVDGIYTYQDEENGKGVTEEEKSFFIRDGRIDKSVPFFDIMERLGKKYEQETILVLPLGEKPRYVKLNRGKIVQGEEGTNNPMEDFAKGGEKLNNVISGARKKNGVREQNTSMYRSKDMIGRASGTIKGKKGVSLDVPFPS